MNERDSVEWYLVYPWLCVSFLSSSKYRLYNAVKYNRTQKFWQRVDWSSYGGSDGEVRDLFWPYPDVVDTGMDIMNPRDF